jgi:hypothetical protein
MPSLPRFAPSIGPSPTTVPRPRPAGGLALRVSSATIRKHQILRCDGLPQPVKRSSAARNNPAATTRCCAHATGRGRLLRGKGDTK